MSYGRYPAARASGTYVTQWLPRASLAMGGVGMIVGGTAAAAKNIRRVESAEINREEAVRDTFKEAAGAGLSTATATAVIGAVGATGFLSLFGAAAVATGAKYLWDAATQKGSRPALTSDSATESEK